VYRADILTAAQAQAVGLATATHEPESLLAEARLLADAWTRGRSPVAVALARQMLLRNAALPGPEDAHRVDSLAMFYSSIGDGKEGVAAFLERREPRFTGRASAMPPFYDDWLAQG
jgi:enoyl-CoA hydratase/carnithine racemase